MADSMTDFKLTVKETRPRNWASSDKPRQVTNNKTNKQTKASRLMPHNGSGTPRDRVRKSSSTPEFQCALRQAYELTWLSPYLRMGDRPPCAGFVQNENTPCFCILFESGVSSFLEQRTLTKGRKVKVKVPGTLCGTPALRG